MDRVSDATVMVAAADEGRRMLLAEALHARCRLVLTGDARDAVLTMARAPHPDLAVLDSAGIDALALCRELQSNFLTADIPVIVVAGEEMERDAFAAGAADVVTDPTHAHALRARACVHVELRRARALMAGFDARVSFEVAERTRLFSQVQDATVLAIASLAEDQQPNVHNHILRTQHYVAALARELRFNPRFARELTDDNIALLFRAAPLHDIGKIGVPDAILKKPGKLTSDEFDAMKQHTAHGSIAMASASTTLDLDTSFMRFAREIAASHHERWDGSGYPRGLGGDEIPVSARLMAVADVYDALISARPYRPAFTHETAVEMIRQGRGTQFDPDVVDAMLAVEHRFTAIAAEFRDPG